MNLTEDDLNADADESAERNREAEKGATGGASNDEALLTT